MCLRPTHQWGRPPLGDDGWEGPALPPPPPAGRLPPPKEPRPLLDPPADADPPHPPELRGAGGGTDMRADGGVEERVEGGATAARAVVVAPFGSTPFPGLTVAVRSAGLVMAEEPAVCAEPAPTGAADGLFTNRCSRAS